MPSCQIPLLICSATLLAVVASLPAHAAETRSAGIGLEYQRWLEDDGRFVAEHGYLPRIELRYQSDATLDHGWQAALNGSSGTVDYRGASQGLGAAVDSRSRYRKGALQLTYWRQLNAALRLNLDLGAAGWRRDIHNPLLSLDQREDYRSAWLGSALSYQLLPQLATSLGVRYPFWASLDAHLDNFGFDASPALHPKGRLSPALSAQWRVNADFALVLDWTSLRFAASPVVELGGARVHQPASRLDTIGVTASLLF